VGVLQLALGAFLPLNLSLPVKKISRKELIQYISACSLSFIRNADLCILLKLPLPCNTYKPFISFPAELLV
jgi:hypothetical protein